MICPKAKTCKIPCWSQHKTPHKKNKDCTDYTNNNCPDCVPYTPPPRMKRIKAWALVVDNCGYYCGISYKGITILQLNPGTVRNKEYGIEFINMLNKNGLKIAIKI